VFELHDTISRALGHLFGPSVAQMKADVMGTPKMYISRKNVENLTQKNTHLLECDFQVLSLATVRPNGQKAL